VVYLALAGLRIDFLARADAAVVHRQAHRFRLVSENASDLITTHARNGDVTYASPAAEQVLALSPRDLMAAGLFRRVHVADRPAFLSAIAQALSEQEATSVEFRARHGS